MRKLVLLIVAVFLVSGCISQDGGGLQGKVQDKIQEQVQEEVEESIKEQLAESLAEQQEALGDPKEAATINCRGLCLTSEEDLSDGPCLSDGNDRWVVDDWVCDIAHSPRLDVDGKPNNQCTEFRNGNANHFVEFSPDCKFIRAK